MLLETLSNSSGPSGYEGEIRKIVKNEITNYVDDIKIDKIGNVIAHKKGKGKKVVIDAHIDEVGFIIIGYNDDGTLKFSALGGVNSKVIPCKVVFIGENKIPGVIGLKPIHLQSAKERTSNISYGNCCIDIGAKDKGEAKKYIKLGDYCVFDTKFNEFGTGLIKGKAFDDRIGCAVLVDILKDNYECDLYGVFNVQEEVGERGAYISAYNIQPDVGIAIEGTICADMPNIPGHLRATEIGRGPAISIMDRTSLFNKEIINEIIEIGNKEEIPYQFRRAVAGGNDAGAIHMSGEGAKVATISVPCRYIHSSVSVCSIDDYTNTVKLLKEYLHTI